MITGNSASLWVGELAPDTTEAMLFELFSNAGPVASIRVCRDAVTRRSLGYAYVNFHSAADAERALETLNFSVINRRPCRIMWSQRDPTLRKTGQGNIFVKNLDSSIGNKELHDTFSQFGNVMSCKVATSQDGKSLGYGFIHFETADVAQKAIEKVNGMEISGKKVHVVPFKSKAERGGNDKSRFTNVYIKNLPADYTEAKLKESFEKFGPVTSLHLRVDEAGACKGFGFANFETPESAKAAVEALHDTQVGDKKLYVARAQKKAEREKELHASYEAHKQQLQKKVQNANLYVRNLEDDVTDQQLREMFTPFGNITSVRVMTNVNGQSRGFGFVCFATPEEATKALTEMNGKMMQNKPLFVALHQRKEERRAMLESRFQAETRARAGMAPMGYPQPGPMYYAGPGGFQPQFQQQQRFMYPQFQQQPQRQGWRPQQMPMQGAFQQGRGAPMGAFQGQGMVNVAAGQRGAPGPQNAQAQRAAGQRGGAKPMAQAQQPRQPAAGQPVRGQAQRGAQQTQGKPTQGGRPAQGPAALQDMASKLASLPPDQQKQAIGEQLFFEIQKRQGALAGKITGMLLEMDPSELVHLLESAEALEERITEAVQVLEQGDAEEEGEEGQQ